MLLNEDVNSAAARFHQDVALDPPRAQVGASLWSPEEKSLYFAALDRLGKDDIAGISRAIKTKTIAEVRDFSLLLLDTASKRELSKVTLRDIPAASEISAECNERLELAGDALAWYQERFEAKQEQERYGKHWLITPEIANELDIAQELSRPVSHSPSPTTNSHDDEGNVPIGNTMIPQILREIPEGDLLEASTMLKLSSTVYMNGSPNLPSWYPHWSSYTSPLASKPSIYRTAFTDLHTLVVSLTKRLIQVSIIQATSRLRSQSWRGVKKAATPVIRTRDVLAAIDVLNLPRDSRETWRRVARRCGLRVFDGTGKGRKELSLNDVEKILGSYHISADSLDTDDETPGIVSAGEGANFRSRAMRSGTPLPSHGQVFTELEHERGSGSAFETDDSIYDDQGSDGSSMSCPESVKSDEPTSNMESNTLEEFDFEASRQDELNLWAILGMSPHFAKEESVQLEDEVEEESTRPPGDLEDWRDWTEYHADWEELNTPISAASFIANRKRPSSVQLNISAQHDINNIGKVDLQTESRRKRRRVAELEIPIRGARAYAAMQDRMSVSDGSEGIPPDPEDSSNFVALSIEDNDYASPYETAPGSD
jgi:hypothetical protein